MCSGEGPVHEYLSTGCRHGHHDYCKSMTGYGGEKRPGKCKFCDAQCSCRCHWALGARLSPEGFVAQQIEVNGERAWVLTHLTEAGVEVKLLGDQDVAGWVELAPQAPEGEFAEFGMTEVAFDATLTDAEPIAERGPAPELAPQWRRSVE